MPLRRRFKGSFDRIINEFNSLSFRFKNIRMSSEIESHITKKYEIKKRLGKGVCAFASCFSNVTRINESPNMHFQLFTIAMCHIQALYKLECFHN